MGPRTLLLVHNLSPWHPGILSSNGWYFFKDGKFPCSGSASRAADSSINSELSEPSNFENSLSLSPQCISPDGLMALSLTLLSSGHHLWPSNSMLLLQPPNYHPKSCKCHACHDFITSAHTLHLHSQHNTQYHLWMFKYEESIGLCCPIFTPLHCIEICFNSLFQLRQAAAMPGWGWHQCVCPFNLSIFSSHLHTP